MIKFWVMGADGERVRELMPEFEVRHPELQVLVQVMPWTAAHEKLLTAYAGNSTPDVSQLGNTWIPEFRILNAIEDFGPWLEKSSFIKPASYFPGIWETNLIDNLVFGIPWYVDTRVLFYRKDLLARAGYPSPPKTWDEWLAAARSVKKSLGNQAGYGIFLPTNEYAPPIILGLQAHSSLLKDNDRYGDFRGEEFARAFEFYVRFFVDKLSPVGITEVANVHQAFAEGFFSMYITGPWQIDEFRRRLPEHLQDKWMTAPLPSPDSPDTPGLSLAGGSSLVMFRASTKKAEVWKLIEFLSEPEQQIRFYEMTGDLPARIEAWQDSSLAHNRFARAFFEQLNYVTPTPKVPEWEQISLKIQQYAEAAARQTMPVEEALAALDREADLILEKRRWMLSRRQNE